MPHPIHSHKSEEGLIKRFFSIDIAKVATRTSSVRLRQRQRPTDPESERSNTQSGCHLVRDVRNLDLTDVEAGMLHAQKASRLKIWKSPASSAGQDIKAPVVQTRPSHYDEGDKRRSGDGNRCYRNDTDTTITADGKYGSIELQKAANACMINEEFLTERPLSRHSKDDKQGSLRRSSLVAGTTDNRQRRERVNSTEKMRKEEWKLVRAGMQVEMDPVKDDYCPGLPIFRDRRRPMRAWKHAERNFFPSGLQDSDQEEVVRTVLERHAKAGGERR
ncbi:hypothetical protein MMC11_005495 [Xylographa trunciseda]|nr:hypothetical protein [Xylographa trunciseda]